MQGGLGACRLMRCPLLLVPSCISSQHACQKRIELEFRILDEVFFPRGFLPIGSSLAPIPGLVDVLFLLSFPFLSSSSMYLSADEYGQSQSSRIPRRTTNRLVIRRFHEVLPRPRSISERLPLCAPSS